MSKDFKVGDLVWAKLDDYPYWPGRIANEDVTTELKQSRRSDGVVVLFFGSELTYGLVSKDYVKSFEDNLKKYSLYKGDEDLKAEFLVAMEMTTKHSEIEDPPLELTEEEKAGLVKKDSGVDTVSKRVKTSTPEEENVITTSVEKDTEGESVVKTSTPEEENVTTSIEKVADQETGAKASIPQEVGAESNVQQATEVSTVVPFVNQDDVPMNETKDGVLKETTDNVDVNVESETLPESPNH